MQVAQDVDSREYIERDFDIRRYIDVLFRRRRVVISITLLVTLLGMVYALLTPPHYQAVATIAIIKTKPDVTLDQNFKTVTDDQLSADGSSSLNSNARRQALVGLVKNSAIAQRVIEKLGDQISTGERNNPVTLVDKVNVVDTQQGDLIAISIDDTEPVRAAAIVNAWAQEYESQINALYTGAPTDFSQSVNAEMTKAKATYDKAQTAYQDFLLHNNLDDLKRQIDEKQGVIDLLQKGKQTALSTAIDEQIKAQQSIISAYYSSQAANRLLAFDKQQEAKRQMLSAYIDAEIQSRMAAFNRDRNMRDKAFQTYVDAEINGKLAVVNQQVTEKSQKLADAFAEKTRLERLIANAQTMRKQIEEGGNSAAASNTLALLLLKSEAFGGSADLPANLQLQQANQVPTTAGAQSADLDALTTTLTQRLGDVETQIQAFSKELMDGTGYNFLDQVAVNPAPLSATGSVSATGTVSNTLSAAIDQKYRELFEVGTQAKQAQDMSDTTQLFSEIKQLYPDLFTVDQLMELATSIPANNELATMGDKEVQQLLQLQSLQSAPNSSTESTPLVKAIQSVQNDISKLETETEKQNSQKTQLSQARDLAWEAFTTLSRKQTELGIASSIMGSEVRFAGPAAVPVAPSTSGTKFILTAFIVGLVLGILAAYLVQFFVSTLIPQGFWGPPSRIWNRAYRWMMTPSSGLPQGRSFTGGHA